MRKAYLAAALLLVMLCGAAALWQLSKSRTFQFFGRIVPRVNTSQRLVALTFDDGPTRDKTAEVLRLLREKNARATFFVTGAELEQNMSLGRDIVAAGHELGNHSYSHERMIFVTPSYVRREVEQTDELIRAAGYTGPIHFRPPYGKKLLALPFYLSRHDRTTITWDVEPDSILAADADAEAITRHVLKRTRPGSIILLHVMYPSRVETMRAVPLIIEGLERAGYRFVTVSELMAAAE
ncbi:MAG: peptidoglycan-N-acetylglucosamine deacetylase [Acidobacteriota bacterium]|nr:peptidoglycan-N-acetylglucosamine deacetylase [Acidobacteriota bacterium]